MAGWIEMKEVDAGGFRPYRYGSLTDLRSLIGLDQGSAEKVTKAAETGVLKLECTKANQSIEDNLLNTRPSYSLDACLHTNPILISIDFEGILCGDTVGLSQIGVSMLDTRDLAIDLNKISLSNYNYFSGPLDGRVLSYRFGILVQFSKLDTRKVLTDIFRINRDSTKPSRNVILVGHHMSNELQALIKLRIYPEEICPVLCVLDTASLYREHSALLIKSPTIDHPSLRNLTKNLAVLVQMDFSIMQGMTQIIPYDSFS